MLATSSHPDQKAAAKAIATKPWKTPTAGRLLKSQPREPASMSTSFGRLTEPLWSAGGTAVRMRRLLSIERHLRLIYMTPNPLPPESALFEGEFSGYRLPAQLA
jgi:hypothetical protein